MKEYIKVIGENGKVTFYKLSEVSELCIGNGYVVFRSIHGEIIAPVKDTEIISMTEFIAFMKAKIESANK